MRTLLRSPETLIALISVWLMLTCNVAFWGVVAASAPDLETSTAGFLARVGIVTFGLTWFLLLLLALGRATRPVLILMLLSSAAVGYFTAQFGILFDENMLINVLETNQAEAAELISPTLLITLFLCGVMPALIVWRYPLTTRRWNTAFAARGVALVIALSLIVGGVFLDQKSIVSLARNHREIRHLLSPVNVLSAAYGFSNDRLQTTGEFMPLGTDAVRIVAAGAGRRPLVHVMVIGETARAASFSLGDYARPTNPQLGRLPVHYFSDVASCGTATSTSLPCMFSLQTRAGFDRQASKQQDNLLDIAVHAGYDVYWRDNGNTCKGICSRIDSRDLHDANVAGICTATECYDQILVHELAQLLPTIRHDTLIVLHQLGSHGPAYYRRYPDAFRVFKPDCRSADIGNCSDTEIRNAYDNTILYTDHIVAQVIKLLSTYDAELDTSLLYVSDHGESLGEYNLYLHGMPYSLAPAEQTHVPMLVWTGKHDTKIETPFDVCATRQESVAASHDNLFHTELGMLGITTALYEPELDMLAVCRPARDRVAAATL